MSTLNKIQFDNLLSQLVEQGASDLHLSVGSVPMLRVADELRHVGEDVLTSVKIEELVFPLLTSEQKKILVKEKGLVLGYTFETGLRFKVNLFYQKGNLAADFHFISPIIRTIKELGLPKQIEDITALESGLVIVTGPFHAGKTTTATAIIDHINSTRQVQIVTLEQPIEMVLTGKKSIVQQREVGLDTPNFIEGLKDCFEASVDVVLVSQLEDKQEVDMASELAEQGRLVIVVTSANSVLDVISKILSFYDEGERKRAQNILSRVLQSVVCQKLVLNKENKFVVVPEIMMHNEAIRLSIQDNKLNQINNILRTSAQAGMVSFEQSLAGLVKQGEILQEEALKHTPDKDGFKQMVG